MKKQEVIIKSEDVMLSYKSPYLLCTMLDEIKKVNGSAISSILVLENCTIDSSVFDMVNKHGVTITFHNGTSTPKCKCQPYMMEVNKDAYKMQFEYSYHENKDIRHHAITWLHSKFENRKKLLEQFLPEERLSKLEKYNEKWYKDVNEANEHQDPTVLIKEAHSSRYYWRLYNLCLHPQFRFAKRSKHPGLDLTNVLLNYGYGILYSAIERVLNSKGLDPYCGIFHVDGPGRKSLVFDMIEAQRHNVEGLVLSFCIENQSLLSSLTFETSTLTTDIKGMYIQAWKNYNEKHGVTKSLVHQVECFKQALFDNQSTVA